MEKMLLRARHNTLAKLVRKLFRGGRAGWAHWFDDPNTLYRRRNRLTYTNGSYVSPWVLNNSGATNPTVTTNYALAPNGTMTAARLQINKTGGAFSRLQQAATFDARQQTASLYVRTTSGTGTANVGLRIGNSAGINMTVTGEWQRFSHTHTDTSISDIQILLWDSIPGNDETADILIWGPQLELGPTPTEYQDVPTTWPEAYLAAVGAENIFAWVDSAGTTPVTAVGDTIGLSLDRAYGGMRGPQAAGDPGFDGTLLPAGTPSSTQWYLNTSTATVTISGSALNFTGASSTWGAGQDCLTVGRTYEVVATVSSVTGGGVRVVNTSTIATATSAGTLRCIFVAASTQITLSASGTTTASVSGVTVREIPGTHLIQATGTARPTLSARVNLLTYTEQFDNAYWAKINDGTGAVPVVTANAGTDPLGGSTADRVVFARGAGTTLGDYSLLSAGVTGIVSGASHLGAVWMKSNTGAPQTVSFYLASVSSAVVNQVIGTTWTRVPVSLTTGTTSMNFIFGSRGGAGYTSDQNLDILVWGADLRTADDAAKNIPAYQRVGATAADHDTDGFPHYAEGDGTDNFWSSVATVDGSGSDKLSLVTALTKNTDAAIGIVLELTADSNISNGSFFQAAPIAAGTANLGFKARGTVAGPASGYNAATYAAPFTAVLGLDIDLSASTKPNVVRPYINGVLDQGEDDGNSVNAGGNFANATLYVLSRAGASSRFNGRFYGSIGRFGPMSDSERNNLTRWWQKRIGTA